MERLLPLLEMGFSLDDLRVALNRGCQTAEDAVAYLTGDTDTAELGRSSANLVLGPVSHSESMFGLPTAFPVGPTHLDWPGSETLDTVHQTNDAHRPTLVPEEVVSRHAPISEDAYTFQREEAKRTAERIRNERMARNRIKAQLLAEMKADREEKRRQQYVPAPTETSTLSQAAISCAPQSSGRIRIRVYPAGSSNTPVTLEFPSSAVYGDLLSNLQDLVLPANPPSSVHSTATRTNSPALSALQHHLTSIRVTDQCFQLITTNWPRQTLPRCTTLNLEDAHDLNACLTQSLVSLGLSDGSGVSVRHVSANCPFEEAVVAEQTHTVFHPSTENPAADLLPNDPSRDADSEPDTPPPGNEFSLAFPPGGQQLVPQPPGGYMPRSGRTLMENLRHRAAVLDAEFHQRAMSNPCGEEDVSVSESHWGSPQRLEDLTFRRLLELLVYYLQRLTRGSQGLNDPGSDQHKIDEGSLLYYAINSMSGPWPERLGQKLVGELREQSLFNIRTASLLRNCVTSLNLNYYPLVTTELITCLVSKWPHLTELQLNGLQTGQIQPEIVDQLGALRNLRLLSLNGLSSVCDRNLGTLINLPELRILRVAGTNVTDAGWIHMAASPVTSSRPLAELDASGLRNNLTSRGLEAIVQLFPNLHRLTIAASEITTDLPDAPTWSADPLTLLTNLDVSDCTRLIALPMVLLPPPAPSRTKGLRILKLHQCLSLDLSRVLDQLRGHPLQHLDGLESIPSLNASLLERYCASGFPLTELHLRRINFSWMVQSTTILARLLANTPTHTLLYLSFPLRKMNPSPDSGECSTTSILSQLGRFHRLQTLDLGGQISEESEVRMLEQIVPQLPDLHYLAVSNLPSHLAGALKEACGQHCTIHLQHLQ